MTTELKQNKGILAGGNLLQIKAIDRLMRSNMGCSAAGGGDLDESVPADSLENTEQGALSNDYQLSHDTFAPGQEKPFTGDFDGIAFGYETPFPEAGSYFIRQFTEDPLNHGKVNDAELSALAKKQAVTINVEERKKIMADIQRKHAEKMYYVPSVAGACTGWTGWKSTVVNNDWATPGNGYPADTIPFRWYKA